MCGRFSLTTPLEGLRALFGFEELPNLTPRTNIAPTQRVAAVRRGEEGGRHLVELRWGLVPSWAKDLSVGARMINARAETVAEKPAFRGAFRSRRCLIAADGFYEWKAREKGPKQPYRIEFEGRPPFAFAGLWESWRDRSTEAGERVESCTIVTTQANQRLADLHDRMPVILAPQDFDRWLEPGSGSQALQDLLKPWPARGGAYGALSVYPVSTALNKVANDGLDLLEPLDPRPRQSELF